jgi:hypothetical protein
MLCVLAITSGFNDDSQAGPSKFTEVTPSGISTKLVYQGDKPQGTVPATKNSARVENEAMTSERQGTEDETKSDATDSNADDSIVILFSGNKTEYKITQDSIINTDAISKGIECTTRGINGLDSNETSLPMAGLGVVNAGTLGYFVSGDRVKRTTFEKPFVFRETVNSAIRDTLNLARTTTGGSTGVSTNLAKIARRTHVKTFKKITTTVSPDTRIQAEITSTRTLTSNEPEMLSEEIRKQILLKLETLILKPPPPQPPKTTTVSPDVLLKLTAKILTQSTPRPFSTKYHFSQTNS